MFTSGNKNIKKDVDGPVDQWNKIHPIGTKVASEIYSRGSETRNGAVAEWLRERYAKPYFSGSNPLGASHTGTLLKCPIVEQYYFKDKIEVLKKE